MIETQFYLFVHLLLYGACMAQLFDTFLFFIKKCRHTVIKYFCFVLFWLSQLILLLLYLYVVSGGQTQSYLVVILFIGAMLYRFFLRHAYRKALRQFTNASTKIIKFSKRKIETFILKPIDFLFKKIFVILKSIASIFKNDHEEKNQNEGLKAHSP